MSTEPKGAVIALNQGVLPPQATELEEAVLGALMIDNTALSEVIDILHEDAFYKEEHKLIFQAIEGLFKESSPVDILTVART